MHQSIVPSFSASALPAVASSMTSSVATEDVTFGNQETQRHDLLTAGYVETALRLQQTHGTSCALEFLQANNVDAHTAGRVLTDPRKRRHS